MDNNTISEPENLIQQQNIKYIKTLQVNFKNAINILQLSFGNDLDLIFGKKHFSKHQNTAREILYDFITDCIAILNSNTIIKVDKPELIPLLNKEGINLYYVILGCFVITFDNERKYPKSCFSPTHNTGQILIKPGIKNEFIKTEDVLEFLELSLRFLMNKKIPTQCEVTQIVLINELLTYLHPLFIKNNVRLGTETILFIQYFKSRDMNLTHTNCYNNFYTLLGTCFAEYREKFYEPFYGGHEYLNLYTRTNYISEIDHEINIVSLVYKIRAVSYLIVNYTGYSFGAKSTVISEDLKLKTLLILLRVIFEILWFSKQNPGLHVIDDRFILPEHQQILRASLFTLTSRKQTTLSIVLKTFKKIVLYFIKDYIKLGIQKVLYKRKFFRNLLKVLTGI